MQRQKPSPPGKDEQEPEEAAKPNQQRGPPDEQVRKGLAGLYRPAMKTAGPRPLSDESADEAEDVQGESMSLESQDSSDMENQNPLVAKKAADPYSPPDSDEDAPALPEAESSDDEIQVKMPVKQPAMQPALPEGLTSKLLTSREKEAILRKELNIPPRYRNIIITKGIVKGSPSSSHAKVKVEYIEQYPPEGTQMDTDEKKKAIEDIGKGTFEKKVEEPMEVEEQPDQGLKEKDDEPNKDKVEQEPEKATEKLEEAEEKVKEKEDQEPTPPPPKVEKFGKKRDDKVAGQEKKEKKDEENPKKHGLKHRSSKKSKRDGGDGDTGRVKKRGLKSGQKQGNKSKPQGAPEESGDTSGTEPPTAKRPKEGD